MLALGVDCIYALASGGGLVRSIDNLKSELTKYEIDGFNKNFATR